MFHHIVRFCFFQEGILIETLCENFTISESLHRASVEGDLVVGSKVDEAADLNYCW